MGKLIFAENIEKRCEDVIQHGMRNAAGQHYLSAECVLSVIKALPPVDAVPVVRCAVCRHFKCNMRGDGTLPKGVDEFECRNGRGGCDPMSFCDEGERKDGGDGHS